MNRQQLLKYARDNGYEGKAVLADVLKFLEDAGVAVDGEVRVSVKGSSGERVYKVAEVWGKSAAAIEIDPDSEKEGDDESPREEAERKRKALEKGRAKLAEQEAADEEGKGKTETKNMTAAGWRNMALRKAYDRKAAAGQTVFPDAEVAEVCGANMRLKIADTITKNDYARRQDDLEILQKAHVEYDNTLGGAFVPIDFSNYLVYLKEKYDDPRSDFRTVPMSRDKQVFDKDLSDLTVYAPGEGNAITASTATTGNVELTTNKLAILSTCSTELLNDSAIPIAEWLGRKMMYSFRKAEQQAFWVGDGTATYFNFVGITQALLGLHATRANIAGAIVGTGDTFAELTLGDFEKVAGRLPDFDGVADSDPCWYMNKRFYFETVVRLALAAGGVTAAEIEGKRRPMLLGYEVKFRRTFIRSGDTTEARDLFSAILGWPQLAATIGERSGVTIAQSTDRYFDQDLIAFRAIERVAFKAHDVGNASATESLRTPGPVVGLLMAAS